MADRVAAVEIARTVDGVTDATSHLRRTGAGMTLCGIAIRPAEARGAAQIWYAVAEDEATGFQACRLCEGRASSFYVVSRIEHTERPRSEADAVTFPVVSGDAVALYTALYQAAEASLSGKSIVDHSILGDVYRLAWQISFATSSDKSLSGNYSAIDAAKALRRINDFAMAIRYDLDPYVPAHIKHEDAPVTQMQARADEIARQAQRISNLCNDGGDEYPSQLWVDIQNAAASILGIVNVPTGSESVETSETP